MYFGTSRLRKTDSHSRCGTACVRLQAGYQGTAGACHNDFAENHGADLVSRPNPLTQEMFDTHRVLEISTWRNIDHEPIERAPLALCDRLSLRRDDLQAIPLIIVRRSCSHQDSQTASFHLVEQKKH